MLIRRHRPWQALAASARRSHHSLPAQPAPRQRARGLGAAAGALWALALAAGCVDEVDPTSDGAFDLSVRALSASCGGTQGANPLTEIQGFTLVVRDEAGKEVYRKAASRSGSTLTAQEVPAGNGKELTLLGNVGGKAKWFARRTSQKIVKNTTSTFEMTLMAVESYTCLAPAAGAAANVVFPAMTAIGKGQILITGGFAVASPGAGKLELAGAQDSAWIFDVDTGELRGVKNNGRMKAARAGHSAIFLPKSNRVLLVGGVQKMTVDTAAGGPPSWKPTDGVSIPYEMFDVESETFVAPESTEHLTKRVFANLMPLADDHVVALAGAPWPISALVDVQSYQNSNHYDPTKGSGQFVPVGAALPLNIVRAGAALAPLGSTPDGGSKYLIWGGDDGSQRAEVFVESTGAGNGVFDGSYVVTGDILQAPGGLSFASLTPIGTGKIQDKTLPQFLSVGGIRHDGKAWLPPAKDDVYLVSVDEAKHEILTQRIAGFDTGIYLHQATRTDGGHVVISGGFSDWSTPAAFTMRVFDTAARTFSNPDAAATFVKRGGLSAMRLGNDCTLLAGGVASWDDLTKSQPAAIEVYCPQHLLP